MTVSSESVAVAKGELCHGCDGPITSFVLISRATTLAIKNHATPDYSTIIANALDEALTEYGYLSSDSEIYPTGS